MNLKDPARVLDEISQEQIPQDLNLLPGIMANIQPGIHSTMKPTIKLRFAALLLALVLLIAFFSLPGVASALKKLIGFVPGVGTVDQAAPLRVLANPVTDTRAGFTLTVESAVLDSTRTVLSYRISGPFPIFDDPSLRPGMCQEYPILRLSDGSELVYPSREGGFGGGVSTWKEVFPAIPAAEDRALLVLPCLAELPAGEGPQDWEIPLAFVPAPPEMTVYPVVELTSPTLAGTEDPVSVDGMQLTLLGIAALDDGYFLQSVLEWENDPAIYEVQIFPDSLHVLDSSGQEVPAWLIDQSQSFAPAENQSMALDLQTGPVFTAGPASLVVDYVGVSMPASTSFPIDVGSSPQPGQTWELNKDLEINGYPLMVVSAEYIQTPPGEPAMLMLYLASEASDAGILTVTAMDSEHEILGTGGSPGSDQVPFRAGWYYKDGFPQGTVTVDITMITIRRSGPWTVTWTPPASPVTPTDQASLQQQPGICLGEISTTQAPGDLPASLSGRIAYSAWNGEKHDLFVSNLDGSDRIPLGVGMFPVLSPDGSRVVYRGPDEGLHVRDLGSGEDFSIPGTIHELIFANVPRWSPDSQQIAFDRITDHASDVYLVNSDGSDLHAVLNAPEFESFLGWAPDGSEIYYQVIVPDGFSIRVLDLQTGRSVDVSLLPPDATQASLSPDGKRVVYSTEQGLFLDVLDNTPPVLLIANPHAFSTPTWSPDGQWIALARWNSGSDTAPGLVVLQPDTCQLFQLAEEMGEWFSSWVP